MLKQLIKYFSLLIAITYLAACDMEPVHTPHIVDNIPERAQIIAAQAPPLSPKVVSLALTAYNNAQNRGFGEKHILTIIDYTKPSSCNRFWVIDLDTNKVLFKELVAHGMNSGELYATNFSDQIDSKTSSVGLYLTANNGYMGKYGYSLRLRGLEKGYNGNAWTRAIVIHSAPYVCNEFIQDHGFAGRSWGCPALNPKDATSVINTIKGGTLIFAYANVPNWLQNSQFLKPVDSE